MHKRHKRYLDAMGIQVWESRITPKGHGSAEYSAVETPWRGPGNAGAKAVPLRGAQESSRSPSRADAGTDRAAQIGGMDWSELQAAVDHCTACGLHAGRTQAVFGVGDRTAEWMIIGEAPGAEEDRRGEPFVGRAGKLLDAMLFAVGLRREQVYIANILKSRPPNNRDPRPEEVQACWPYLLRQIELVEPTVILAVGRIAAQNLLLTDLAVGKLRGRIHRFGARGVPVVVTYHPAYLLRAPAEKQKVWEDLQLARRCRPYQRSDPVPSSLRHDES